MWTDRTKLVVTKETGTCEAEVGVRREGIWGKFCDYTSVKKKWKGERTKSNEAKPVVHSWSRSQRLAMAFPGPSQARPRTYWLHVTFRTFRGQVKWRPLGSGRNSFWTPWKNVLESVVSHAEWHLLESQGEILMAMPRGRCPQSWERDNEFSVLERLDAC